MNTVIETQRQQASTSAGAKKNEIVEISINSTMFQVERGNYAVEKLRTIGSVPANEILSELKGGKFHDLQNNAHIEIKGGEVFVSHPASGGSS
jgi:hypothetical protein